MIIGIVDSVGNGMEHFQICEVSDLNIYSVSYDIPLNWNDNLRTIKNSGKLLSIGNP